MKMSKPITTTAIYAAINPLPARLSAKGKVNPEVKLDIEANAGFGVAMNWKKRNSPNDWEREYKHFTGDTFDVALGKAVAFIEQLPDAKQAILHEFMGNLGRLIDAGRADGIAVDYLNPLLDSMKRLSENVITHRPVPDVEEKP